jgi:integrase/recombinase XerD
VTTAAGQGPARTPARRKARQLAKYLRAERPDYAYLKEVFRHLRDELGVEVTQTPKKLPYVPTEAEIRAFYDAVWKARRAGDVVLIKTLLYTGVRVAELVRIRLTDVDLDGCRIRITQGKGAKDRYVPFPAAFKENLALHIDGQRRAGAAFLFESSWKRPYSDRSVRKILTRYTQAAGIAASISPHKLRHFLFTWLDPGHRRRAHPALQRPRHPPVPGDLLPPRPRRRPAALRRHRRLAV